MENGQLTVVAENSTLGDVLNGIGKVTGIKVESANLADKDRVAAQIGPAPVREVLYSLLQGSKFDYIILSALNDPEKVERVMLSTRVAAGPQAASNSVKQAPQPLEIEPVEVMDGGDDSPEGFAPPAVTTPSPAPGTQGPAQISPGVPAQPVQNPGENRSPDQIQPNREGRPERPR